MTYLEQPAHCLPEQRLSKTSPFIAWAHEERPNRCVYFVRIAKSSDLAVNFCNPAPARFL